jgi:trans-2,3-dihydro-3-hydroxyanthranilate isomerase
MGLVVNVNSEITLNIVAAFTDDPSAGSPTGVVLDLGDLSVEAMQQIANQSGCSHTAFVNELGQEAGDVNIRFFTAGGEIKNCAHATIAAHYLRAQHMNVTGDCRLKQHTLSGIQDVEVRHQNDVMSIYFKQDPISFSDVQAETIAELLAALKLSASALDERYPIVLASPGSNRFLIAINDMTTMNTLQPDFHALKALCARFEGIGCFVFAMKSANEADARMFAPNIGVDEDIINGNSSGCLGAYLLRLKPGLSEMNLSVYQGQNFNRPGTVMVNARRVGDQIETWVGGRAVTISQRQVSAASV